MKLTTSLDWQKIRSDLVHKAEIVGKYSHEMKKIVTNLDEMITRLSVEEINCRRHQKQTKTHKELCDKINEEIENYERMITFGVLLN